MDSRLLDYYNDELATLRESGAEFAKAHPKIAGHLSITPGDPVDPYVERIVESFCYLTARTRVKLDTEFPRFAARLLEVVHPGLTEPMPSIAVARFFPDVRDRRLIEGFQIARGSPLTGRVAHGEQTACEFRTSQDVVLYPIEIAGASLTDVPRDVASLARFVPANTQVRGALRFRLRITGDATFAQLHTLDRLPVCLTGEERPASHLFELVHTGSAAVLVVEPGSGDVGNVVAALGPHAVAHEGLDADEGLLPLTPVKFHGHNLIREYLACPRRFHFFALTGLAAAFSRVQGREVEIIVLLNRPPDRLAGLVDASHFALFCTPVVNLFRQSTDRVELSSAATEFHLVPRRRTPLDYEVFAVEALHAYPADATSSQVFRPLYQTLNGDEGNYGRYFSVRRESRVASDWTRRHGSRTPYTGTEVYVSLVDQRAAPYSANLRFLSADAWLTNRDLPMLVPRDGVNDLFGDDAAPVASVGLACAPSAPGLPFSGRDMAWRLIRQLNVNSLSFEEIGHRHGGLGLRDLLRLFAASSDAVQQRQIESLVGMKTQRVSRKLANKGPLVFANGIECLLTVDEDGFSGISPYLFGLVLEQYLMRHAAINTFTQTELHSMQRGCLMRWPARVATRGAHR
ncbi:type VI secretion system baseplate subunit TssF [Paraburkholderia edwinii]|uniref:Type VI secretion system baseplate subunit TssF n=1 Tax=Paraburkholderia edwinii TaxID=2861782 RepID=A0ABX8UL51_9BURK|nr:type VI secretion system baseplate subunit TssF [Paraburkholderia edwinii]QYD69446.1 type VI secretion system baseplate subunit TssF [Paraburkholderia edwinii]